MWTYPDATDMDCLPQCEWPSSRLECWVPRNEFGEGRPTLGWGRMPTNFEGWEDQAYIRQQRMSAAADVLGQ
jgi:hypothetical protein